MVIVAVPLRPESPEAGIVICECSTVNASLPVEMVSVRSAPEILVIVSVRLCELPAAAENRRAEHDSGGDDDEIFNNVLTFQRRRKRKAKEGFIREKEKRQNCAEHLQVQ